MNGQVQDLNHIRQKKSEIEKALEIPALHDQQRSSLYIAYAGLAHQESRGVEMLNRNRTEMNIEASANRDILMKTIREVSPVHPLWEHEIPLTMTDILDQHNQAIRYVEEMARYHMDDHLVRNAILYLTRLKATEYADVSELPYYKWVIERYGDRNLARLTRRTFQQERQK